MPPNNGGNGGSTPQSGGIGLNLTLLPGQDAEALVEKASLVPPLNSLDMAALDGTGKLYYYRDFDGIYTIDTNAQVQGENSTNNVAPVALVPDGSYWIHTKHFSAQGTLLGAPANSGNDQVQAASTRVDKQNNLWVSAMKSSSSPGVATDYRLWKLAPDGQVLVERNLDIRTSSVSFWNIAQVDVDSTDNVYVNDVTGIKKLASDGTPLWQIALEKETLFPSGWDSLLEAGDAMRVDKDDNLWYFDRKLPGHVIGLKPDQSELDRIPVEIPVTRIEVDGQGRVWYDQGDFLFRYTPTGAVLKTYYNPGDEAPVINNWSTDFESRFRITPGGGIWVMDHKVTSGDNRRLRYFEP